MTGMLRVFCCRKQLAPAREAAARSHPPFSFTVYLEGSAEVTHDDTERVMCFFLPPANATQSVQYRWMRERQAQDEDVTSIISHHFTSQPIARHPLRAWASPVSATCPNRSPSPPFDRCDREWSGHSDDSRATGRTCSNCKTSPL